MPVDPANLDAVMVLGAEVPAEGLTVIEEQQGREPDEDVEAVQAGEAEEVAAKAVLLVLKPIR